MNKIYKIIENKGFWSIVFALITVIFGTIGYVDIDHLESKELLYAFMKSFELFGLSFPSLEEINFFTVTASFSAVITITLTAILFFFKEQINKKIVINRSKKEHIGIFGLGQISRAFLKDCSLDANVIIIDKNNQNAEEYREKGFGILTGDAFDENLLNKSVNFDKMKYALIAFGDDRLNIEFVKKIISVYHDKDITTPIKLIVHINNKNFSRLFSKNVVLGDTHNNISMKTFSYYEECARDLFSKYSIDGDSLEYMNSKKLLDTVVAGDGELIKNIVYKIIALSHFPNQNRHTIHVVDKSATKLLEDIKAYVNYGTDNKRAKFPTIDLVAIDMDYKKQDFYAHEIWQKGSIENIIICYDDESTNIELGTMLHEKVYLSDTIDGKKVPKIIMALYDEFDLSYSINANKDEYKNMFTFGGQQSVINKEHLLNETIDKIAKLIHKGYGSEYNKEYLETDDKALEEEWFKTSRFSDKLSNISQARHIDIKLKAFGLQKQKSNKSTEELLKVNADILDTAVKNQRNISDDEIKEFKVEFWQKLKEENLFNKLTHMEHERWSTHHYLEGWKYSKTKNKSKKEHNCLIPLEEFDTEDIQLSAVYDMYSFLYLPNYLAQARYEIKKATFT